jgi:hypothetical protein
VHSVNEQLFFKFSGCLLEEKNNHGIKFLFAPLKTLTNLVSINIVPKAASELFFSVPFVGSVFAIFFRITGGSCMQSQGQSRRCIGSPKRVTERMFRIT